MSFGANRFFSRRYLPVWLTLVLGLAATGWLARSLYLQAMELDQQRFKLEAAHLTALLESTMERNEERLARLADYCAFFDELPTQVWYFRRDTMTDFNYNLPSVVHAVYCPKVAAAGFEEHASRGRKVWGEDYGFDPQLRPERPFALPVWQYYSRNGFPAVAAGTDMAAEADWHPSLLPAMGRPTGWVSPLPGRVQRSDGTSENGFWFALPLFKPDQTQMGPWRRRNESVERQAERHRALRLANSIGLLAVFISTDRMVDAAFNDPETPRRLHVRLYASKEPATESLLNPVSLAPIKPQHREVIVLPWYGRRWAVELTSTPRFEADSPRSRSWLVLAAGSGMTLLASALLGGALRARTLQDEMIEQIRDARDALAAAQLERNKFSRDLHDGTIQSLYAIQLGLGHTVLKLDAEPVNARRELMSVRGELDVVIAEIRRFITAEKRVDTPVDLRSVLVALVQRARRGTTAQIEFHCDPDAVDRLTGDQSVQLANIAREALSNSLRHAKPERVEMALRWEKDAVALEIHDNGVGFDPASPGQRGVGLTSMASRVRDMGAALDIQSSPGQGCRVVVRVPASHARAASPEFRNNNES